MPYRKEGFFNDGIYHIILRGIEDNKIFKDVDDYYRGIFSIYEFNNSLPVTIQRQREHRNSFKKENAKLAPMADMRNRIVDVLSFCFMPNHIHLLLKQLNDNGITKFMAKVGTGYAGYFNRKYQRRGYVFQNRFKDIRIESDNHLKIIFTYIHANPISLLEPNWKDKGIKNSEKVINFLEEYKWHSYPDFIGGKNFPSVTERDFLFEAMGGKDGCREAIKDWVDYKHEANKFSNIFLE